MGKVVGAVSLSLILASAGAGWSQEIGMVTTPPNAAAGELVVDIPARPNGEKVYIVRSGTLVTDATVKSSGGQGGSVLSLPDNTAAEVQVGDRVSLTPSLSKELPASAYDVEVKGDVLPPSPGQRQLAATAAANGATTRKVTTTKVTTTEVGAPEPPPSAIGVPLGHAQLEKTERKQVFTTMVAPVMAESTPRGTGVPLYPAPAVAGIAAPYGQGLAAAAPVGTPYLRSPAFAGPPVIYMPQTVTRVLLPGATPYPSNIMSPPANYTYSSAPFLRTDIYTSLPYGTFYWPQGYAGTTPVEPQVPAYVTAPASAVLSTEADYSTGRYVPGVANEETLNPITSGINSNLVASTSLSGEPSGTAASVSAVGAPAIPSLTVVQPGPEVSAGAEMTMEAPPTEVNPFPVMSDVGASATSDAMQPGMTAMPTAAPGMPAPVVTPVPVAPTQTPAVAPLSGLPDLPSISATPTPASAVQNLPNLPANSTDVASAMPALPASAATATPSSMMPSLPTPTVSPAPANVITVDGKTPGAVTLAPADGWTASASTDDSFEGGSELATVEPGKVKTATFNATIPSDGQYEVALWWVGGVAQFRSADVPVTIETATGPVKSTIDQTQAGKQWHVVGTYQLKAGQNKPVLTVSTDGVTAQGNTVSVSVDAMRLTPQ